MTKIYKITGYHDFRDYLKNNFSLKDEKYWTIFKIVYEVYRSGNHRLTINDNFYNWINSLEEDELKTIIILSELSR